jgi:hypothetical protein
MDKRLIELALEALEVRKAALDAEIAKMRSQRGGRAVVAKAPAARMPGSKKRGPQSRSARKAQSERMKAYWAKRRAEAARKR